MQVQKQITRVLSEFCDQLGYVCELCQPAVESMNASAIAPGPLCHGQMFSFQDFLFFVFGTSEEDSLCNKMSQDGIIACYMYSSSILYMTSYIMFLQMFCHNICNRRKQKQNRLVTRQFFPSVVNNCPGIRLITNSSYCNLSTTCHLYLLPLLLPLG